MDQYGNQVQTVDDYGNPLPAHPRDQPQMRRPEACGGGVTGEMRRSGSSSSSEDDGMGGRRKKKGFNEKVKEKLPGGHKKDDRPQQHYEGEGAHEKKGIMKKIKEKLPGSHQ